MEQCLKCIKCDTGCIVLIDDRPVPPVTKYAQYMDLGCGHEASNMAYGILRFLKGEDIACHHAVSFKLSFVAHWVYGETYCIDVDDWLSNKIW